MKTSQYRSASAMVCSLMICLFSCLAVAQNDPVLSPDAVAPEPAFAPEKINARPVRAPDATPPTPSLSPDQIDAPQAQSPDAENGDSILSPAEQISPPPVLAPN